jgi:hypothetical protein
MKRLERDVLLADRASVARMLERLPEGDVLGRASFERRLSDIDEELEKIGDQLDTAGSVALMFGGQPVLGGRSIDAEFASKVLDQFHSLVAKKVVADEVGALGSRGRIPERSEVNLAITEIVRGSVGFLLEERNPNTELADSVVKLAIDQVTQLVAATAAASEEDFERAIDDIEPRVVVSLRDFFRTLDDHRATVRIVEEERDAVLDAVAVHRARERVDATEIEEAESESVVGELLGLLPESRKFEMRLEGSGEVIKGTVAGRYAETYLELIEGPHGDISGQKWRARMRIREVRERNKPPRKLYTLIGLLERIEPGRPAGGGKRRTRKR